MKTVGLALGVTTASGPTASGVKTNSVRMLAISPVLAFFTAASISQAPSLAMVVHAKDDPGPKSTTVRKGALPKRVRKRYERVPGSASCAAAVQVISVPRGAGDAVEGVRIIPIAPA